MRPPHPTPPPGTWHLVRFAPCRPCAQQAACPSSSPGQARCGFNTLCRWHRSLVQRMHRCWHAPLVCIQFITLRRTSAAFLAITLARFFRVCSSAHLTPLLPAVERSAQTNRRTAMPRATVAFNVIPNRPRLSPCAALSFLCLLSNLTANLLCWLFLASLLCTKHTQVCLPRSRCLHTVFLNQHGPAPPPTCLCGSYPSFVALVV